MATMITSECINCGACESECPNTAIYAGGVEWELNGDKHPPLSMDLFYIVPEKCTECVGFFDHEACGAVCPVDCCIPNPDIPESEAQLVARAKQLHPDKEFPPSFPSRFRKEGAEAVPKPAAPTPAPAGAPAPAPTAPAARAPAVAAPAAAPVTPAAAATTPAAPAAASAAAPVPAAAPAPAAAAPTAARALAPAPTAPATASPAPAAAPPAAELAAAPRAVAMLAAAPELAAAQAIAESKRSLGIPPLDEWEVPIDCFRCNRTYAVPFKHVRSGVVLFCPSCSGSYVVTTSMYGRVSRALADFDLRWAEAFESLQERRRRELEEFEERQRRALEEFTRALRRISVETKPPGAPRKRAWIFG